MSGPNVRVVDNREVGRWEIYAYPVSLKDNRQRSRIPITQVRGIPTVISSLTFTEPFGPGEAMLSFPGVTPLEPVGFGSQDLWWMQPDMDIDITWTCTDPQIREYLKWVGMPDYIRWEGFVSGFDWKVGQGDSVSVMCTGAMRMLDTRMAQRVVASRPVPFERAIERSFFEANRRHTTRLQELKIELLPSAPRYARTRRYINGKWYNNKPWYMQPVGLNEGDQWSGLLTRELGTWGKLLSDYIAMLLKVMYTETGQYTLQLDPGRKPVLRHRNNTLQSIFNQTEVGRAESAPMAYYDSRRTLIVNLTHPGVTLSLSSDYSQSITTIYGNVRTTLTGTEYNGVQFEGDGTTYWYEPFAKTPWVDSDQGNTPWANADWKSRVRPWAVRREIYDEFPEGLTVEEAKQQARRFLSINGSPGLIGNLTLDSCDPAVYDKTGELITFPRQMVGANTVIRLDGFAGEYPGPLVYANEVTYNAESDTLNCQIDSKFRDFQTTAQVKIAGRDALLPNHTMNVKGGFTMGVQDPIFPWSYAKGCGYYPYGSEKIWQEFSKNGSEPEFFEGWEQMTRAYPPREYPWAYTGIRSNPHGRGTKNDPIAATYFWNVRKANLQSHNSRVLLSQEGNIMSTQFMCVDRDGVRQNVSFHVSIWNRPDANANNTPRIPTNEKVFPGDVVLTQVTKKNGKKAWMYIDADRTRFYEKGSHYPFYEHAWFAVDEATGKKAEDGLIVPADVQAILYGAGNYYDRPGFWPGVMRNGDAPTGLHADTTEWSYTMKDLPGYTDLYSAELTKANMMCTVLIYCDDAPAQDLFFIGRLFKRPEESA